jgi:hypothetical protein
MVLAIFAIRKWVIVFVASLFFVLHFFKASFHQQIKSGYEWRYHFATKKRGNMCDVTFL